MRYFATVEGKERTIDIESLGGSQYRIAIDGGQPRLVDAQQVEGSTLSLLVENRSYDVDVLPQGESVQATVRDTTLTVELLDERRRRMKQASASFKVAGPVVVTAPMPGKVVKVLVEPGQEVAEGQGVIIIEAMKMENELRSPKAGKVREVKVREGQTVEGRAELVAID